MLVGVVRRGAVELLVARDDAVRVQPVEHRAVQLQRDALRQPVVDHPGDLRVVGGPAPLGLHQAGHGDDLAFGQVHLLGRGGQVDLRRLLLEPLDHAGQDAQRALVRHHLVGRREQVALRLPVRVGGQVQLGRVLQDRLVRAGRDAGLGAQVGHDLAEPPALRDRDRDLHQVLLVEQQRVGQRRLHVQVHAVEAGQQAVRVRAVLGGQDERAGAGHHAELGQLRAEAGRRLARGDLDHDVAGARARVVGRVVLVLVQAVDVRAADAERDQDDQQGGQRRDPAQPAPPRAVWVRSGPGCARARGGRTGHGRG